MASKSKGSKNHHLAKVAEMLFGADGKEPYYLGGKAIRNLEELVMNLDSFSEEDANWLSSWMEYLGDPKTGDRIRKDTSDFKKIIMKRYDQLQKYKVT